MLLRRECRSPHACPRGGRGSPLSLASAQPETYLRCDVRVGRLGRANAGVRELSRCKLLAIEVDVDVRVLGTPLVAHANGNMVPRARAEGGLLEELPLACLNHEAASRRLGLV